MKSASDKKKEGMRYLAKLFGATHGFPLAMRYAGIGQILMFHRVVPNIDDHRIWSNSFLEITERYFENVINYYTKNNYKFVSIDELQFILQNENTKKNKIVHFTFDDGYKDNLTNALPILEKHKVPATVYITNDFPDKKAILWWYGIEDYIINNDYISYTFNGETYASDLKTKLEKESNFNRLHNIIQNVNKGSLDDRITDIFSQLHIDKYKSVNQYALDWEELKILASHDLITIGAHTTSHPNLAQLNKTQLTQEIIASRDELSKRLNRDVNHFAYPFGGLNQISSDALDALNEGGFYTAVTTISSNLHYSNSKQLLQLPRIAVGMSMNEDTLDLIRFGFIPFIRNKGKKIITLK